jgi:AraC-like DNA-binding protein
MTISEELEDVLHRLRGRRLRVRLPRSAELFRSRPKGHFHATAELFWQTGGGTDFDCAGEQFRLRTHEVCVIPSGMPHAETPLDLRTAYGVLVCMEGRDGFFLHRGNATPDRKIVGGDTEQFVSARGRSAFRYLDEIGASFSMSEKYRKAFIENLLEAFLLTLLSEMKRPMPVENSTRSPLVIQAEKRARANIADTALSVARLASDLGCSADYLSRRFHQERGQAFTAWLNRERIALARDFLSDSRFNIAEIGWACGFSAPSYFIRVFQKHTGLTPRAYRLAQTNGS